MLELKFTVINKLDLYTVLFVGIRFLWYIIFNGTKTGIELILLATMGHLTFKALKIKVKKIYVSRICLCILGQGNGVLEGILYTIISLL